ncbi:MFS general substrate transporter [Myriangium duriaei CBS 260.36]|uniref:MFS general substrate transporter n=1 Tax=Myriangium duriaei CBS 260.36 TaxID=1168546 RepID=A0A9P4IXZ2_9PEZI|nr:MFS general substrate transporter [Myriangium duriaei CBS 260.36]
MWDIFPKVWAKAPSGQQQDTSATTGEHSASEEPKNHINADSGELSDADSINKDAQAGVQDVEAVSSVWNYKALIIAYVFIYLIYIVNSFQEQLVGQFSVFVTSDFSAAPLVTTTGIFAQIIGGLARLPVAKILDVWGRPQGLSIMVFCLTLGLIIMAACNNVETYAAGQVFYWVGVDGVLYVLSVFIADTTLLKNRGLMLAFGQTPYIFTTFAGPPAAQRFLEPGGGGWRWGYGTFAIVVPVVCAPVIAIFVLYKRKAQRLGLVGRERAASGRTALQSIWHYIIELDIFGVLLLIAGLAMFLLPFNIYTFQEKGWHAPLIICLLVFGIIILILFGLYEAFLAPKRYLPMGLLFDRTVLGSCIYAAIAFLSFYLWDGYLYSFLLVVNNVSVTNAGYIRNIYSIGSCFWGVIVGLLIKFSGRYKWLAVYVGVPLSILGVGLMINFRQPDVNIGFIIMCQIFIAFGGGTTVICQEIAILAASSHQHIAVVLAIQAAFASIGGAIGSSISTAIWTNIFPNRLQRYLPAETASEWSSIYLNVTAQQSYPVGSPTRDAINQSYGDAQRIMLIAGTCFLILGWFVTLMWRDISVKGPKAQKQVKGLVI